MKIQLNSIKSYLDPGMGETQCAMDAGGNNIKVNLRIQPSKKNPDPEPEEKITKQKIGSGSDLIAVLPHILFSSFVDPIKRI